MGYKKATWLNIPRHVQMSARQRTVLELTLHTVDPSVCAGYPATNYSTLDITQQRAFDYLEDIVRQKAYRPVDTVVCISVLEHLGLADAESVMYDVGKLLHRGGKLVLTCAGPGHPHGVLAPDEHYSNIYPQHIQEWLTDWRSVVTTQDIPNKTLHVAATR